jgi:hypothetical protein
MGQSEIIDCLNEAKKPLSRAEIAERLQANLCQVSHHLAKLIIHQEIKIIEIDRIKAKEFFNNKAPARRMRLYYTN